MPSSSLLRLVGVVKMRGMQQMLEITLTAFEVTCCCQAMWFSEMETQL